MATKKPKTSDGRVRNFATVVYPESAPEGWLTTLGELCIPAFVSPLHDMDVNPTGEVKKPHHHVVLMFEGKKSVEQAKEVFDMIGGVGCEIVNSLRGYARYLCHLDNPEKAQYQTDDVLMFGGADYPTTINLPTDKYKAIREMMAWCIENQVTAYSDLLLFASEERFDWFRVLCDSGTVVIKEFLKSESWKMTARYKREQNDAFDAKIARMKKDGLIDDEDED